LLLLCPNSSTSETNNNQQGAAAGNYSRWDSPLFHKLVPRVEIIGSGTRKEIGTKKEAALR
jgi:hypothetical protein